MSLSYVPLSPVRLQDPVQNIQAVTSYGCLEGGSQISYKPYISTNISSSSMQFSCPPPSGEVIVDRDVSITVGCRLTFTSLIQTTDVLFQPATSTLNDGKDAPRELPFLSGLDNLQVGINNDKVSMNMSDMIHTLTKFNLDTELANEAFSMSPTYPDQSFEYGSMDGSNRSPLAAYADVPKGSIIPRGGFSFKIVSNPTVVPTVAGVVSTAVVDMVLTEPILMSPFFAGKSKDNVQGFYNVNAMDFNFNILSNAAMRMWSHDPLVSTSGAIRVTSTITAASVQFNNFTGPAFSYGTVQPSILFKYITPNALGRQNLGPNVPITYPYYEVVRYPTQLSSPVVYGIPQTVQSNNIQLSSIPKRLIIVGRLANSVLEASPNHTDCFLAIQGVSIQFSNQQSCLSNASQQQLFKLNVENGSNQSWVEWSGGPVQNSAFSPDPNALPYGTTGGPLSLSFGKDIPLSDETCPGMLGQYNLQVDVRFANMNATGGWDNLTQVMYLICVFEGTFTITSLGSAQHQLGVISKKDVLEARSLPSINYRMLGGDFFTDIKNLGSNVLDWLKNHKVLSTGAKIASNFGVPFANSVSDLASSQGYGMVGGLTTGGQALITGGARMTKAQIRKRLC